MRIVRMLIDSLIGSLVRRRSTIQVDPSARVRWSALWGTRGGNVKIGEGSIVNCRIAFDTPDGQVEIGRHCYVGSSLLVCHSSIHIGDDTIISWGVTIVDHDSHTLEWAGRFRDVADWREGTKCWDNVKIGPVRIEERVWIGFGASILKGVRIGRGAVVGAGSVVTGDVGPYSVVAGNPARLIRTLKSDMPLEAE